MRTNLAAQAIIKFYEGLRLTAYLDSVGIPTIGYGHIHGVKMGDVWTLERAETEFQQDVGQVEELVLRLLEVPVSDNQLSAMVSFTYNLGIVNFHSSTLLKRVNAFDFAGAADEFLKWDKAGGQVLSGLSKRRIAERALFMSAA